MSTIAAISTPIAVGGLSVIRISGDDALKIASKIFQPFGDKNVEKMKGYTCCYGNVVNNGEIIDDAILTVFLAPKSYTGENVCEISCHGGIFVSKEVLEAAISAGAKLAEGGDFTKRAFLNGKLSLTHAESVMDLISAKGKQALRCAVSTREGKLFLRIEKIKNKLVAILGKLSVWVDYPDEDLPEIESGALLSSLKEILSELDEILSNYESGKILREGVDTVILGKPNVGKSTLMNLLLGYDRSIVTDVPGTTRDIVEESVKLGELVLKLSDTAGLRKTDDLVEGVGVNLAFKKLESADLVIAVFDNSQVLSNEDFSLIDKLKDKPCVAVINKSDLVSNIDRNILKEHFNDIVEISAKNNEGISQLSVVLNKIFKLNNFDTTQGVISNLRQKKCVESAQKNVNMALEALAFGETYDAITVLVDEATSSLLELTGEKITEVVVDEIFSKFCVGK